MTLTGCQTTSIREYFNAPDVKESIVNECTGYQNGELIDVTNHISVDPSDYEVLKTYYEDKEYRLYICLKYPRKCK
jgi:hypothetical protein